MFTRTILTSIAVVALLTGYGESALAMISPCPPGQVYGDISAALNARGAKVPPGTMGCKSDEKLLGLNCPVGDPVAFLMQKRVNIPEYEIQRMGSAFACNLAKFIDAGEKAGAKMQIYSGARNFRQPAANADCQRVPCVPSTHELGCAADLTFNGARQVEGPQCSGNTACVWAHQHVNEFGLQFRLMPQNGFNRPEPWHIEIAGARGPANLNSQGYCPNSPGTPTPNTAPTQSRTPPAPTMPTNPTAAPQSPSCPSGSAAVNGVCAPQQVSNTQSPFAYDTGATTGNTNTATSSTSPNTAQTSFDQIQHIAYPTPTSTNTSSSSIGTSIGLSTDLQNISSLNDSASTSSSSAASNVGPSVSQTFVSGDLRTSANTSAQGSLATLLETLKRVLTSIVQSLKPFGGVKSPTTGGSEYFE